MSYSKIVVTEFEGFSWNYPYSGGTIISNINDVSSLADVTATMPPANDIELGQQVIFNNTGNYNITLATYGSIEEIIVLAKQTSATLYTTDASSAAGEWGAIQISGGSSGIVSLNITAADPTLKVTGGVVTSGTTGTVTLATNAVLQSIGAIANTGILVSTKSDGSVIIPRTLVAGSGISITNTDGSGGNMLIAVSDTVTNLTSITVGDITFSGDSITTGNAPLSLNGFIVNQDASISMPATFTTPGTIKAWVVFNNVITTSTNIVSILGQFNITDVEVEDANSSGYYTIIFAQPFANTNYGVTISLGSSGTPPNIQVRHAYVISKQTTNLVIAIVDASGQLLPDAPNGVTITIVDL